MPCLRHTSAVCIPPSCSRSTAMICSSLNLVFLTSVSSRRRTLAQTGRVSGEQVSSAYGEDGFLGRWTGYAREYGPRLHLGIGDHDVLPPPVPGFIPRARFGRWNLVKLYRLGIGIIDDGRRRLRAGPQRSRIRVVIRSEEHTSELQSL